MRDYGSVCTSFWIDPQTQSLTNESKLLALYLLTGPHTNMLGCFRLPVGYIAEDLHWDKKNVLDSVNELSTLGFITYDSNSSWVLIHEFLKYNPIENPNQGKSIAKLVDKISESSTVFKPLMKLLINHQQYLEEPFRNRLKALSKEFRNQDQDQDQDQDQEQDQEQNSSMMQFEKNESDKPFEAIMSIPLIDKTSFLISKEQMEEWQSLYTGIDVIQELKCIRDWNIANPTRRKTSLGILKHINIWLTKTQEKEQDKQKKQKNHRTLKPYIPSLSEYNHAIASEWLLKSIKNDIAL
jgi:uncharacterized damage-inducible protein DinB